MSEWDYHEIRIIGAENELERFSDHYIFYRKTGVLAFGYNRKDIEAKLVNPENNYYGDVELKYSFNGQLIFIKIYAETTNYADHDLIYNLQSKFPELIFHSNIYFDYDIIEYYHFTRIHNGKVCQNEDGVPIIDEKITGTGICQTWFTYYESKEALFKLATELDNDVRNFRILKLRQIEERNSSDQT
jgi:hypothetical protein